MALIELAKVIAEDPAASRRWAARAAAARRPAGTAAIAARFAALPASARTALLVAAVADGPDLRAATGRCFRARCPGSGARRTSWPGHDRQDRLPVEATL